MNARRGTAAAIFNGCVTTPGIAEANVIEDLDPNGSATFRVQAIVSDQNGQANSALASNVTDNLQNFRALGVPVIVIGGKTVESPVARLAARYHDSRASSKRDDPTRARARGSRNLD